MEYEALINRILEAEQTAREITREAHEKQAHMEESLKQEEARIKADYLGAGRPAAGAATPGNRAGKGQRSGRSGRPLCRRARQAGAGV